MTALNNTLIATLLVLFSLAYVGAHERGLDAYGEIAERY